MIVYPQGLPRDDPLRLMLDGEEDESQCVVCIFLKARLTRFSVECQRSSCTKHGNAVVHYEISPSRDDCKNVFRLFYVE